MTQRAFDYAADAARNDLLARLKLKQESGPMRPALCIMEKFTSSDPVIAAKIPLTMQYQWMFYAGMGDVGFHESKPEEAKAAVELLARGAIVPTFKNAYYDDMFTPLRILEDVNWGFRKDGSVIIFDLPSLPEIADGIITPDETYNAAIDLVKRRIEANVAGFDRPVRLSDDTEVTPVIFGRERLLLRARQNRFAPER